MDEKKIEALLDELMKNEDPQDLLNGNGVLADITKRFVERALEGEMTAHLGYAKHSESGKNSGNSRTGKTTKKVLKDDGAVEIEVPRDRNGEFEPQRRWG